MRTIILMLVVSLATGFYLLSNLILNPRKIQWAYDLTYQILEITGYL